MRIRLSDHFTYSKLIRFVLPSVVMMVFTSIYGVVDGFFVSNFAGKTPFAAVNFIMPFLMGLAALGFMIGAGGSALVAKTLGEGRDREANGYFSLLIVVTLAVGIVLGITGALLIRPVALLMGADSAMLPYCVDYGRLISCFVPAFMLQNVFQSFFIAAEKPRLGLAMTVSAGVTNMVLDALFLGVLGWGVTGAAAATGISQIIGGILPVIYFLRDNDSLLRLTKPPFSLRILGKVCANGSSELMTNLSMSIVNILYNYQLMRLEGENGVAAYGVIMYVNFIFIAIFIGYSIGSAPVISYHFGAQNGAELKNLLAKSVRILFCASLVLIAAAELTAPLLAHLFVGYDDALYVLTCRGFRLFCLSFLFSGYNIFGSAFFTALNNGPVSAIISFLRTLVFQIAMVLLLPMLFGIDGVWCAIITAEFMALCVTVSLVFAKRKKYGYG